ncbi:MAG TPA: DedA family protein [Yinghuangia sp.]|uniref:DedA family protein n=1 Tax=Yinghuangia sp. YIM S10712 TaxID=3436930 RepID=UPI002BE484E3|nr:DedA family protein [Yinghuangia sp.]
MVHDIVSVLPAPLVLAVIGAAVVAESALLFGLLLPGSTLLVALGLTTRLGDVPLAAAFPVAIAAAVLGGQLAYLRGRHHDSTRTHTSSRLHKTVLRAEQMVARHGVWSIAVAQWIAGLRTFAPRLAGRAEVPYRTFWLTQIPVAAIWAAAFVSVGHFAGLAVQQRIGTAASIAGAAVVVVGLVVYAGYALRRRKSRTAAANPAPAAPADPRPVGPWLCSRR